MLIVDIMRNFIAFSLLIYLLAGCYMPNDGNNLEEEGGNPLPPDYEITLPEEPEITTPATAPSEEQSVLLERIMNSLGNMALTGYSSDVTDAMKEYAKENPAKNDDDRLREIESYTHEDTTISGWFTIPSEGTITTPPDAAPLDISFSVDSGSGKAEGCITMSHTSESMIIAMNIYNHIPSGEDAVESISKGFIYQNMDSTSMKVIITADFMDNGHKHTLYYRQEPKLIDQETGELDEGALCILDDENIEYVLFGFEDSTPEYVPLRTPTTEESNLMSAIGLSMAEAGTEIQETILRAIESTLDKGFKDIRYSDGNSSVEGSLSANGSETWEATINSYMIRGTNDKGDYALQGEATLTSSNEDGYPLPFKSIRAEISNYYIAGKDGLLITSGTIYQEETASSFSLNAADNAGKPHKWEVNMTRTSDGSFEGTEVFDEANLIPFFMRNQY